MGGDGHNDDDDIGILSQDSKTDYGDYRKERQRRGMGVDLGGRRVGGNRDLADKGVRK